ncbi:unnamed protein product, partial [Staurois parvus]
CSPVRPAGVACPRSSSPHLACLCTELPALQSGLRVWPVLTAPPLSWHVSIVCFLLYSPVLSAGVWPVLRAQCAPCLLGPVGTLYDVVCPQSLVISCTVSAVSGHPLYCVRSLWSSPVLCLQSLVISC